MAREPINYWEKRSTELMKRLEKGTENTINSLIKSYEQATKDINKEIRNIFKNYAKDTGLKKETLLKLLNKKETEQHYKNLLNVIDNYIVDDGIKKKLLAKYNAPAYAYRISRYEALQQNIDIQLKKIADIEQRITEIRYTDTIKEGYYHNIYDIQKGIDLGFNFAQIDTKTINLLLNENWIDNANFSQRIWNNSEKLCNYLRIQLTAASMPGKSINKIAKELSEYMNVGLYNSIRLVRTEVNHFANEAEMLSYEELDIEKYRYIATLDNRTCDHCAELDNKVFNVKDRKPGKNCPPIHSNDRCTTVAEFDDDVLDELQRRARDENGKPILVPQDMSYKDWYNKYVTNGNNSGIIKGQPKKTIKSAKTFKLQAKYKNLTEEEYFQLQEKHRKNITEDIRKSIYVTDWDNMQTLNKYGYINSNYSRHINYIKRTEDTKAFTPKEVKEFKKTINNLEKAIKNNTLDDNIQATRYLDVEWFEDKLDKQTYKEIKYMKKFDKLKELKGKEVLDNQFISGSLQEEFNVYSDRKVRMTIQADKGINAFITENKMEREIIFDSSKLLIKEISINSNIIEVIVKIIKGD